MIFLSNSFFSGLAGPNKPAFSYSPKKNVLNPAVKENYLNSFLYAEFFASRGGSKKIANKQKRSPVNAQITFTGLLTCL